MHHRTGSLKIATCWMAGLLVCAALPASAQSPLAAEPAREQSHRDLVVRSETTIDRPPDVVWPVFVDMARWIAHVQIEHVAGLPGREGEIRGMHKDGNAGIDYFIKTVRVVTNRQFAVKVVSNSGKYVGFANFTFLPEGGKTHMIYDVFLEYTRQDGVAVDEQREHDQALASFNANNARLKDLVEARR